MSQMVWQYMCVYNGRFSRSVCVCICGGGGGAEIQSVERATPGHEVEGSIPALDVRSLLLGRCQYNVTG